MVFCPGKSPEQIVEIMRSLFAQNDIVLATRASSEVAQFVRAELPGAQYYDVCKALLLGDLPAVDSSLPSVNVISAGTADVPVAEEAALVLQAAGIGVVRTYDVGVAGLHRLLDKLPALRNNLVSVVVAGMDGVLPSVVAGLLAGPSSPCPPQSDMARIFRVWRRF